jgi:hypothetical protein
MTAKTRQILDAIEDVLLAGHNCQTFDEDRAAATELWDIMSALRGPDADDCVNAKTATVRIRTAAFPRLTQQLLSDSKASARFANKPMFTSLDKEDAAAGGIHFEHHIEAASMALKP